MSYFSEEWQKIIDEDKKVSGGNMKTPEMLAKIKEGQKAISLSISHVNVRMVDGTLYWIYGDETKPFTNPPSDGDVVRVTREILDIKWELEPIYLDFFTAYPLYKDGATIVSKITGRPLIPIGNPEHRQDIAELEIDGLWYMVD